MSLCPAFYLPFYEVTRRNNPKSQAAKHKQHGGLRSNKLETATVVDDCSGVRFVSNVVGVDSTSCKKWPRHTSHFDDVPSDNIAFVRPAIEVLGAMFSVNGAI